MSALLTSPEAWGLYGSIATWMVQWLTTRYAGRLTPNTPGRRAIRWLHGLLNTIDPEGR